MPDTRRSKLTLTLDTHFNCITKSTLHTVFSTRDTVKYLTSTFDSDPPFLTRELAAACTCLIIPDPLHFHPPPPMLPAPGFFDPFDPGSLESLKGVQLYPSQ